MKKTIVVLCVVLFLFFCNGLFSVTSAAEPAEENATIILTGAGQGEKVAAERIVDEALATPVYFISNTEVNLHWVLLLFARSCCVPVFCDEETSARLEIPVTISIDKPIPLKELLEHVLKSQGSNYTVTGNAVHIVSISSEESAKTVRSQKQSDNSKPQTISPIFEQLKKPFSCNIKEQITLLTALKQINEMTGASIIIVDDCELQTRKTLLEIATAREKPFHFYFPFKMPLSYVLDYLTKEQNLAWSVLDNYILITSQKRVKTKENELYLKTYYIGDLLDDPSRLLSEKEPSPILPTADSYKLIMDYITVMIDAETWDDNIMVYSPNKSLVIQQSNHVHKQIAELLKTLQQFNQASDHVTKDIEDFDLDSSPTLPTAVHYYKRYDVSDLTLPTEGNTEELVKLIQTVISSNHWEKCGGLGTITVQENSSFFVFQEHSIHTYITNLLEQIRQVTSKTKPRCETLPL